MFEFTTRYWWLPPPAHRLVAPTSHRLVATFQPTAWLPPSIPPPGCHPTAHRLVALSNPPLGCPLLAHSLVASLPLLPSSSHLLVAPLQATAWLAPYNPTPGCPPTDHHIVAQLQPTDGFLPSFRFLYCPLRLTAWLAPSCPPIGWPPPVHRLVTHLRARGSWLEGDAPGNSISHVIRSDLKSGITGKLGRAMLRSFHYATSGYMRGKRRTNLNTINYSLQIMQKNIHSNNYNILLYESLHWYIDTCF